MHLFDFEVFQFVISDAGPEGKFVLDLKNGSGQQKLGGEWSGRDPRQKHGEAEA